MEKKQQRTIMAVVITTAFITTFTGSALNLSIPDIGRQFDISAGIAGWLITGYTLAVAAFSVPSGRIADVTGRKTVLAAGIMIFTVCCIAAVFSMSVFMLLAARILQGTGAAMIFSTNTAVLISSFPEEKRGRALGCSMAATYAGLSAGPALGGFLNYNFGWRSIFILTGVLGAAAFFAAAFGIRREKPEPRSRSLDFKGNLLYAAFIVFLMYGLSETGKGVLPILIAVLGVVFGVLFAVRESRIPDPAVKLAMFREKPGYAFSNISALLNYGATFAIGYLVSIYLQVVMGFSSQSAGFIMIAQPAMMAVLSPLAGKFSDRLSPFRMASAGMAFCAAGTGILIFAGTDTGLAPVIAALLVSGFGFSLFSSPNTNAVMSFVKEEDYGVASSILATMRSVGNTLSMVIVTVIFNGFMEGVTLADASPDVLIKVTRISFAVFTAVCTAGIFLSLKRK